MKFVARMGRLFCIVAPPAASPPTRYKTVAMMTRKITVLSNLVYKEADALKHRPNMFVCLLLYDRFHWCLVGC